MKILFIGNSFIYFNDMPEKLFKSIADSAGISVEVSSVTKGGCTLERFADKTDEYGARVEKLLAEDEFDAVILQEQSPRPISEPESFKCAVRALYSRIKKTGADVYLYATWGYESQHPKLSLYGDSTFDMEAKLRRSYREIADELDVTVCNVGMAMSYAYIAGCGSLYREDKYHPDLCGSILAAITIFSTVFKYDPMSLSISFEGISDAEMSILKEAAAASL